MEQLIQEHLQNQNYYEAHQVILDRFGRLMSIPLIVMRVQVLKSQVARKKSRKKYKEAAKMASDGCSILLQHQCSDSATDLGQQMLELYTEADIKESEETLATVLGICKAYPVDDIVAQSTLIKAAIKWSKKTGEFRHGNPLLHNLCAEVYTRHHMYDKAQPHFLRGDQPEAFATMLRQWSSQGYASEQVPTQKKRTGCLSPIPSPTLIKPLLQDLFLARAILGLLALRNMRDANTLYSEVTKSITELTPMHNFLRFLLLVLERDAAPLFQDLRKRYAPTIERDSSLNMFLDAIAQTYYNIKPMSNPLADMMKGLMS